MSTIPPIIAPDAPGYRRSAAAGPGPHRHRDIVRHDGANRRAGTRGFLETGSDRRAGRLHWMSPYATTKPWGSASIGSLDRRSDHFAGASRRRSSCWYCVTILAPAAHHFDRIDSLFWRSSRSATVHRGGRVALRGRTCWAPGRPRSASYSCWTCCRRRWCCSPPCSPWRSSLCGQRLGQRGRHFHPLFQFQLMGINGAFLTGDVFNLFVFFEVMLDRLLRPDAPWGGAAAAESGSICRDQPRRLDAVPVRGGRDLRRDRYAQHGRSRREGAQVGPETRAACTRRLLLLLVFCLKAALVRCTGGCPPPMRQRPPRVAALFMIMTKVGAYSIIRVHALVFGVPKRERWPRSRGALDHAGRPGDAGVGASVSSPADASRSGLLFGGLVDGFPSRRIGLFDVKVASRRRSITPSTARWPVQRCSCWPISCWSVAAAGWTR